MNKYHQSEQSTLPSEKPYSQFLHLASGLLGSENIFTEPQWINKETTNSLGVFKSVPSIIYPRTKDEVKSIVSLCNQYNIPLYPISAGKNIGYGEKTPYGNGQVIVSLEKMNRITDFDADSGEITVEPGVTQKHLYDFLQENGPEWMADVTGAPTSASIVGNTLDGGSGHTPLGNHREHILEIEAILGNGEELKTGRFPTVGPNLAPLFIQSNLGIVVSMRIPLMRKPDVIVTYMVQFENNARCFSGMHAIKHLRHIGVIQSLVHMANATRIFMSTSRFPSHIPKSKRLTELDCLELQKLPLVTPYKWAVLGGLYGTSTQVKESKRLLKTHLKDLGKVQFFTEKKFGFMKKLAKLLYFKSPDYTQKIIKKINSLESLHGLVQGIPTDEPYKNILWRTDKVEDMGLIWISPVIIATSDSMHALIKMVEPVFEKYNFEMPLTMILIDNCSLVCNLNISFDKSNPDETKRAYEAYDELSAIMKKNDIRTHRGLLLADQLGIPEQRLSQLKKIKREWDGKNIIAPGRYGI